MSGVSKGSQVLEFTLVVWLAKGGMVERAVEAKHCREALALYQRTLATGQTLYQIDQAGRQQIVLDVRCHRREPPAVS